MRRTRKTIAVGLVAAALVVSTAGTALAVKPSGTFKGDPNNKNSVTYGWDKFGSGDTYCAHDPWFSEAPC